jgi:hypothetical protein
MSAPVIIVYSRAPELKLHFDDLRKDRHVLKGARVEQPFYAEVNMNPHLDSRAVVALSKEPWLRRVHEGMKRRLDLYKEKRKTFFDVFVRNNPYLLPVKPCFMSQYKCLTYINGEGTNCCVKCCCAQTYVCCLPLVFLISCPYNYGCRYCTGEKQWLQNTMEAHPELDGRVLDHQLSSSMFDYAIELNATSMPKLFDFSFRRNVRMARQSHSEERGTQTDYELVDQLIMNVRNKPAGYVRPTNAVKTPAVSALAQEVAAVPIPEAVAVLVVESLDDEILYRNN